MKKTLAIALSLALAIVLAVGIFVFASSAAEKTLGETRAEAAWAEANKATSFVLNVGGKNVTIDAAVTDKTLADLYKDVVFYEGEAAATSAMELLGKITFADGVLTLDGVAANAQTKDAEGKVTDSVASAISIVPNGGLYITIKNGDFYGGVNLNNNVVGGKADATNATALPDKSHLIITSTDGSKIRTYGANAITNTWGHIIFFGDIELDFYCGTGYDAVICRSPKNDWKNNPTVKATTYTDHDIVLAPNNNVVRQSGTGAGPAVDNRQGNIVYGSTDMIVICEGNVNAPATTYAGAEMVLEGNMMFLIENGSGPKTGTGKLTMKDNVVIYQKATAVTSWAWSVSAAALDIQGGTIIADWNGFAAAAAAPIQTAGVAGAADTVISGGKFFFNLNGGTAGTRVTGLLFKGPGKVNLTGGDFYIDMVDAAGNESDAVIRFQNGNGVTPELNFDGANFKITGNENVHMFQFETSATAVNFKKGSVDATIGGYLACVAAAINPTITVADAAKVSIVCGIDNKGWNANGTLTINGTAATAATKEIKNGTVIAMTETAPNVLPALTGLAASDITEESAKLTWNAIPAAKAYKIIVNDAELGTVTTNEAVLELVSGLKCDVEVVALITDNITVSATTSFTTLGGAAATLPAPQNLKLLGASDKKAIISWDAVEGAAAYIVYIDGVAIADAEGKAVQVTDTKYVLTGIDKEVDVAVTTLSVAGESEKSAAIKVKLAAAGKYPTLVEVTLADGSIAYLSDKLTEVAATTGKVTFDAATGTVTLDGTTGVRGVSASKALTILVKGENTVGIGQSGNIFQADDLIFDGDGKLVIEADASAYPILGQSNVTFQGDITVDFNGGAKVSSAIHAARGTNDTRGGTGDASVVFKGNAKVDIDASAAGVGVNVAGLRVKFIVTDKADVTINAKGDAVKNVADAATASAVDLTKGAYSYTEFSGKSKCVILMGNCGFRCQVTVDTSADAVKSALYEKATPVDFVVKGNAKLEVTAPGQTVYLRNDGSKNSADITDVCTLSVSGNAQVKITNPGWPDTEAKKTSYPALQINSNKNVISITGGTFELINKAHASVSFNNPDNVNDKGESTKGTSAIIVTTGTNDFSVGADVKTFIGGKDAETNKNITAINIGNYYLKTEFEIQNTSDVSYTAAIVLLSVAALAAAAVVVIRKKSYNK